IVALLVACAPPSRAVHDGGASDGPATPDASPIGGDATQCSSDLREVLDGNGDVIGTCPIDEGCAAGKCIPACDAAGASPGSLGCDFVVAPPSFLPADGSPCFAVFVANNWPADAAITVTRAGTAYDPVAIGRVPDGTPNAGNWPALPSTGVASSSVGVLFLS